MLLWYVIKCLLQVDTPESSRSAFPLKVAGETHTATLSNDGDRQPTGTTYYLEYLRVWFSFEPSPQKVEDQDFWARSRLKIPKVHTKTLMKLFFCSKKRGFG